MPAKKKQGDRSQKALEAVAELFAKKPGASNAEFRAVAEKADSRIAKLPPRSFNAKYVLPFKRSAAAASGKGKVAARKAAEKLTTRAKKKKKRTRKKAKRKTTRRKKRPAPGRAKVKRLIQRREKELMAAASDPAKAYELAAAIDDFVDRVVKAAG